MNRLNNISLIKCDSIIMIHCIYYFSHGQIEQLMRIM